MKRCGGKLAYLGVLVLLLKLHMADGNSCSGQKNGNGTLTFNVNSIKCDGYSWKINGTVVAYDQNCTKTLVQEHGPNYIIFKSCQTNVSYFCDRDTTINCADVCNHTSTTTTTTTTTTSPAITSNRNSSSAHKHTEACGWLVVVIIMWLLTF